MLFLTKSVSTILIPGSLIGHDSYTTTNKDQSKGAKKLSHESLDRGHLFSPMTGKIMRNLALLNRKPGYRFK